VSPHPFRLGFAVKVLGGGGIPSSDTRRWQSGPHLSRSLELLDGVFDHLQRTGVSVYRMSSSLVPYGTHPDLPQFDYRRQIEECAAALEAAGERARALGLRLSTHPGQYTVLNALDGDVAGKAALDLDANALLLDALGLGPEAVVVLHVGGRYGDPAAAVDRFCRRYELLPERARRRLVVEHDETSFSLVDVLEVHRRTGAPVVFDLHHHRCNPSDATLADAYATWPAGVRPKAHLSSARTELRDVGGRLTAPRLDQHADLVTPWDAAELLRAAPGPLDVMVEAKGKDLAVERLRAQLARLHPELAEAEERAGSRTAAA
jgi:UV DNA damage endonuclease